MSLSLDCPPLGAGQKLANSAALGSSTVEDGRGVGSRPDAACLLGTGFAACQYCAVCGARQETEGGAMLAILRGYGAL